uniref:Ig-like domain-containing protein n=1 Tax=Oryzias melastigma TaxID=30732 RepID=A0A3B3BEL8_ORYME
HVILVIFLSFFLPGSKTTPFLTVPDRGGWGGGVKGAPRLKSSGALAGKVVLPCHFFRTPLAASTSLPLSAEDVRVKWVKLEEQEEMLVLVAQNGEVKVGEMYHGRVSVPIHPRWDGDASLVMDELRASDAGLYRCEVVEGMDISSRRFLALRYPITRPRQGCEGDLMSHQGVRTYGVRDATEEYDVYCFIEHLNGDSSDT